MNYAENLEKALVPHRNALKSHVLYKSLHSLSDIRTIMEQHVFAVWDFMSLLKALQRQLTCTDVPWVPTKNPELARFINEIVLGEESDVNAQGVPRSHFEMYLDAMQEIGADTSQILDFLSSIRNGRNVSEALASQHLPYATQSFVNYTFEIIATGAPHQIASAFTFGREDLIPDMFIEILQASEKRDNTSYQQLRYYLERHIELDGDHHGPLALQMVTELCENDPVKWEEATLVAEKALTMRLALWDSIAESMAQPTAV
ncbi:DUF3050 domain-containing protein [Marinoscillum furvescens]|uniref:DUF3050 family protein n=1 Tax=Marinoscillum furvescens DSM 4134 TaxID=1122208 RepID=A0A3D9L1M6_MARFU|nr:DUF3050 domain-containing protein [Marinoscillum furvescens]RED95637.1 hypothetical protein C7460_11787 [Marinoscillum furvescens DSM 4134]